MCLIIDANLAATVFCGTPDPEFRPLIDWLTAEGRDGVLVVGGQLSLELDKIESARRFVRVLLQAGRARQIPSPVSENEAKRIALRCASNDSHIIALARISGARLLCSNDVRLHKDFTDRSLVNNPRGHVYQASSHAHLVRLYGHTAACRNRRKAR